MTSRPFNLSMASLDSIRTLIINSHRTRSIQAVLSGRWRPACDWAKMANRLDVAACGTPLIELNRAVSSSVQLLVICGTMKGCSWYLGSGKSLQTPGLNVNRRRDEATSCANSPIV